MKTITMTLAALTLATASFSTLAATEVQSAPAGEQTIGTVSASSNGDLSTLQSKLNAKATEAGASSYRIIGASGENHMYGTAELYK
ncbi:multiple stress resistance protein BhsA [Rahnella sp. PAMC25617]|uniref:multiple stress resistance protein BhsA n=1 Tax=Rahnella TaxID=34037 RepID=UPI000DD4B87B|nr:MULTISPECIES: YdgH/BhsA/McbA-like domain containing protein [Rahnella]RYJ17405.1 multiple stress resistance protein BhsA [Rahnella variigena]TCQ93010.1 multiple stress resistance protein BhsA [Rahnella sp. JUb53]